MDTLLLAAAAAAAGISVYRSCLHVLVHSHNRVWITLFLQNFLNEILTFYVGKDVWNRISFLSCLV